MTLRNKFLLYFIVFCAGMLGAALISWLTLWARSVQLTPINLELELGSWVTGRLTSNTFRIGVALYIVMGGLFGVTYAAIFAAIHRTGWGIGLKLGVIHWYVGGILLLFIPYTHSPILNHMEPPGVFWLQFGAISPILTFFEHVLFGALIGAIHEKAFDQLKLSEFSKIRPFRKAA